MKIIASTQYRLKTLTVHQDLLILVQSGEKRVISPKATVHCVPGQILLLPRGSQWEVVNDPAGRARYEALCVAFDHDVLTRAAQWLTSPSLKRVQSAEVLAVDAELGEAIARVDPDRFGVQASPVLQSHRLVELLLLLAERGGIYFEPYDELTWAERVRRLIAQRPDADWKVENLAAEFHVSASSLRRRLEGEQLSVAAIVREVRLEIALALLQKGEHAVGEVAQMCGWASHSRFTAMFFQRWGVLPSVVRADVGDMSENSQSLVANG